MFDNKCKCNLEDFVRNYNNTIKIVRGDDSSFFDNVFLILDFKTNLNLDGYYCMLTIENTLNVTKKYEIHHNTSEINFDKNMTSTLDVGTHKCSVKLIDTLNKIRTVYNFNLQVENEFNATYQYLNEYEIQISLDIDGISKYKNYNELFNKPQINGVDLENNKSFQDLGIDDFVIGISNEGIRRHNEDIESHKDLREQVSKKQDKLIAGANITIIDNIISSLGADGGISNDYRDLGNKPKIEGTPLDGDMSLEELGIQPKGEYITEQQLELKGYLKDIPSGYVTEEELLEKNYLTEIPEEYFTDEQNEEKYVIKPELDTKQNVLTAGENINIDEDYVISSLIPEYYITEEELAEYHFVNKSTLDNLLNKKQNNMVAGNNIRLYTNVDGTVTISAIDSRDPKDIVSYNSLSYKPSINNIALIGNKTLDELNIQIKGNYQNKLTAGENVDITDENIINFNIPDNICTDLELEDGLSLKADKSNTLAGYNIEDAYTKEETDENIYNSKYNELTDVILSSASTLTSEYTETTITTKNGLNVLMSNGLLINGAVKNTDVKLEQDILLNISDYSSSIDEELDFYLILVSENNNLSTKIIDKNSFKILNTKRISNTETGYIKNLYDNTYYNMIYQNHGIYMPHKINMIIIGEGKIIRTSERLEIESFLPYLAKYLLVTQNSLSNQLSFYQKKLSFKDNFLVNQNNEVYFQIPNNYVTREYLTENDYATQININDAIFNHNTNDHTHQDIRDMINQININLNNKISYSLFNALVERIDLLEQRVRNLETR